MKRDGLDEILFVAIVLSIIAHIGAMFYVRPRVMTSIASGVAKIEKRQPMRVTRDLPQPPPVRIEAVKDVDALKDAPEAAGMAAHALEDVVVENEKFTATPEVDHPTVAQLDPLESVSFDIKPISIDKSSHSLSIPIESIETPKVSSEILSPAQLRQDRDVLNAAAPVLAAPGLDEMQLFSPGRIDENTKIGRDLDDGQKKDDEKKVLEENLAKMQEEIREKVDEKVVETDKAAVKSLIDGGQAEELVKFVNTTMSSAKKDGWVYFKAMIAARSDMQVVPKDFVILIDASGSIGPVRMESIRKAAKNILRSAANSGDRFNLVAFRNRYTYAFRRWQECTRSSFDAADKWLDDVASFGRTDVFSTIRSVLTLPRTPSRPLIALVVTDGEANVGVKHTAEILSKFTKLNDGLVSVYMYGVTSSGNRELIDLLTRGNRGESFVFGGRMKWRAGSGIEGLAGRFRDPVLSDIRVIFSASTKAQAYPRLLKNLYKNEVLELVGRVPQGTEDISFSLRGLSGNVPYEGFFKMPLNIAPEDNTIIDLWHKEREIDLKLRKE
jgi:Mg-chelatase subunit ChlD